MVVGGGVRGEGDGGGVAEWIKEEEVGGGECREEGTLLVGVRSEGADLKEPRVRLQREEEKSRRSGVKDVGERGSDWYRSSVQPGSKERRDRTGEELWVSAHGA